MKHKNKSIQGRRNRCHAKAMLPILKCPTLSGEEAARLSQEFIDATSGGSGRLLIFADSEATLQYPTFIKRPRFIS